MWQRFERDATFAIDTKGGTTLSVLDSLPNRCLRISQEDLAQVNQAWRPILESMVKTRTAVQVMADPYTGDDWQAYGPLLSLSFGSQSERSFDLLWDYQLSLPEDLDTAVISTLEAICSNSRRAKTHLLRGLPRHVASRLECSADQAGAESGLGRVPTRR